MTIQFSGVAGEHGEILVRDDGHGMDLDTLMSRWMQPAGSMKGREGRRFTTAGRRLLGEKGVGSFAADKLASHLELVSRPTGAPTEIHVVFDWNEFEHDDRMLSDVRSRWEGAPPRLASNRTGPYRLSHLRAGVERATFSAGYRPVSRVRSRHSAPERKVSGSSSSLTNSRTTQVRSRPAFWSSGALQVSKPRSTEALPSRSA